MLDLNDFEPSEEKRSEVQKYLRKSINGQEVAFKELSYDSHPENIELQVSLLGIS